MIKMQTTNGEPVEKEARKILEYINDTEWLTSLINMQWNEDGKLKFLTGQIKAVSCEVAEPLSEAEAKQAIAEYKEMMSQE